MLPTSSRRINTESDGFDAEIPTNQRSTTAFGVTAPPSSGECALAPDADDLVTQLRAIKISDDTAVLTDMSAKLKRCGIFAIEELQGLSMD